jgi:hypothetical protein
MSWITSFSEGARFVIGQRHAPDRFVLAAA